MWRWIASFGESYNGDVLQYAKQLFSLRLPQMTKYCFMRECDNIHPCLHSYGSMPRTQSDILTVFEIEIKPVALNITNYKIDLNSTYIWLERKPRVQSRGSPK